MGTEVVPNARIIGKEICAVPWVIQVLGLLVSLMGNMTTLGSIAGLLV